MKSIARHFYHNLLLLTILLALLASAQENGGLIVGGERAGPFTIGSSISVVERQFGAPSSQSKSAGDPLTTIRLYQKQQLGFLVNPDQKIIGITVARSDWKTKNGLGVGSSLVAFQEIYGKGLKRGQGQLAFPDQGLALTHVGGVVKSIYVVKKDDLDPIKGDHLVIGGTRAGQLRLGTSTQDLLNLLGQPMQKEGREQNIWVYPDRGIRLGFIQDRLHMIGVTSGDWVTPSGLKVGRPFSEMKRELGSQFRAQDSSVFFDKWGIGARLQGDQIVELLIFNPKRTTIQG